MSLSRITDDGIRSTNCSKKLFHCMQHVTLIFHRNNIDKTFVCDKQLGTGVTSCGFLCLACGKEYLYEDVLIEMLISQHHVI